jgi:hypothetical protein
MMQIHDELFLSHREVIHLKQITIRGIPEEVERVIQKEAQKKGLSINKSLLLLLEKAVGSKKNDKKKKSLYHDLDRFFGIWTKEEAETFEKNLDLQREIDEEIWRRTE